MSEAQTYDTVPSPSRRRFIRGLAATAGAAAVGASLDPVDRSQAITPSAFGPLGDLASHAGGIALGWALREYTVLGADDPPEGLTPEALKQNSYQIVKTRHSTNASTIVDNQNILDGVQNNAYIEGKLAAFEGLNAGKSQSEVETAATDSVDVYETTIRSNLFKTWNEAVLEAQSIQQNFDSHSEADASNFWSGEGQDGSYEIEGWGVQGVTDVSHTLPDGTNFTVKEIQYGQSNAYAEFTPLATNNVDNDDSGSHQPKPLMKATYDGDSVTYMEQSVWNTIYQESKTTFNDVRDGLLLWIDSIYGQVQSGSVTVEDLITPRERAAMMTDDGKFPQAVADLLALNVPVNFEREATVSLDYLTQDVSLKGTLGITSPPDSLTPGTYSPSGDNLGSVYLTYDVGSGVGYWSQYDSAKGVDGGTVEFEAEPLDGVTYAITTNYNETAEVTASDFTKGTDGSSNTVWTVDVSGQLDNSIAEINEVTFFTKTDETRYETIQLEGQFTIEKFTNRETGEEVDSAGFENSEPQSDSNYVTQEEWDELQAQNERLIDLYEESQNDGGGSGGGGSSDDGQSILDQSYYGIPALGWVGGGLVTLAAIASRGN